MSSYGPFLGLNNRLPDSKLTVKDVGQWLRQAVNVDINDAGWVLRRAGSKLRTPMVGAHSLWSNGYRTFLVYALGLQEVISFSPLSLLSRVALTSDASMSFVDVGGDVYFSNGTDCGRIAAGASVVTPWALATPAAPVITTTSGTLNPGDYQVSLSYSTASGEEGGSTPSMNPTLSSVGGFSLVLPGASPGADYINIYISGTDGELPCWYARLPAATTVATITAPATGREMPNAFLQPQPAGQFVATHNGRLLVATDALLTYSPPWNLGLYLPTEGYIPFPAAITNIVPCIDGVYITADRTYWLAGPDIAQAEVVPVLPYGAVPGTAFRVPHSEDVGWYGFRGVVVADRTGQAKAIQQDAMAVDVAPAGAALVREVAGVRSVVVALSGASTTPALVAPGVVDEDAERLHGL